MLVRTSKDEPWRELKATQYADEAALEELLRTSPELLPGSAAGPVYVVSQLAVPNVGTADIVVVDRAGAITIVECKLRANSEIRRWVIGQVFSYAAGLWQLSVFDFDRLWQARAGTSLLGQLGSDERGETDPEAFRSNLQDNLKEGRFRLVIAVDEITSELKRTVSYINDHTEAEVQVLALELRYYAEAGIEVLMPAIYGEEAVVSKIVREMGTRTMFLQKLRTDVSPEAAALADRFLTRAEDAGATVEFSRGSTSAIVTFETPHYLHLSLYEWPKGKAKLSIDFEYMVSRAPKDWLTQVVRALAPLPVVGSKMVGVEAADFKKRPGIPFEDLLADATAEQKLFTTLESLSVTAVAPIDTAAGTHLRLSEAPVI